MTGIEAVEALIIRKQKIRLATWTKGVFIFWCRDRGVVNNLGMCSEMNLNMFTEIKGDWEVYDESVS